MPPESRPTNRASKLLLVPVIAFLALWTVAFAVSTATHGGPNGERLAGDFSILLAGARVQAHGANPYDRLAVYAEERRMLGEERLPAPAKQAFIRVGNPPLLFWALRPLARLSFTTAAWIWLAAMSALLIVAVLLALITLGWRRKFRWLIVCLCMPQAGLAVYYGNVDAIVLFAAILAFALARTYPVAAGGILVFTLLKPQLAPCVAVIFFLFWTPRPWRALAGLSGAASAAIVLTVVACGASSLPAWGAALTGYSHQIAVQPDIASLTGLYVYSTGNVLRLVLEFGGILVAAALTLIWWLRIARARPAPLSTITWLAIVWFLATPFAHFHDEIILLLPALALLGMDGRNLTSPARLVFMYCLVFGLLLFPTSRFHVDLQSLALIPAAIAAFAVARSERAEICISRPAAVGVAL